jgi:hypothetical protein
MSLTYEVQSFQSGTVIVTPRTVSDPHLYVYHSNDLTRDKLSEDDNDRIRYMLACDLRYMLNGGPRPAWLDGYTRTDDHCITGPLGGTISAIGPMILPPNDNGRLAWMQDPSPAAITARKALIDRIWVR